MGNRFHVLIVEDEPAIAEVLVAALESHYRLSTVGTVGDATAVLRTTHIDLALIDHLLPDGHGSAVARVAAELGVPVIEMTGLPNSARLLPEHLRLCKPFGLQELFDKVEHTIGAL